MRAAGEIWTLAPWKKWGEDEIFAVQQPDTGDLGFVSVLGGGKEQFGIIVYRGADAYFQLLDFIERVSMAGMPPWLGDLAALGIEAEGMPADLSAFLQGMSDTSIDPTELLGIPQIHLDFESKKELDPPDLEWVGRHDYKAKGRGYPMFRAFVPGYLPWWLSSDEARFLATTLEQFLEVARRKWAKWDELEVKVSGRSKIVHDLFARLPKTGKGGTVTWSDGRIKVSPNETVYAVELDPDEELLERIAALPKGQKTLEMELVSFPVPFGGEEERPHFPSLLLAGSDGTVAGYQPLACGSPSPYLVAPLLAAILKILAAQTERPAALVFASPEMAILGAVAEMTDIPAQMVTELPTLDPAIEELMAKMESGELFEEGELPPDEK